MRTPAQVARNKRASYEDFAADCPTCGHENMLIRWTQRSEVPNALWEFG